MDFKQLEYINAIAQEKNITKAADRLYISRSALNYSLLKLEEELGTPLFNRVNNLMIPTFAGSVFLEGAQDILKTSRQMRQRISEVASSSSGRLVLGMANDGIKGLFTQAFARFHQQNPQYQIELKNGSLHDLREALQRGELGLLWSGYNGMGDMLEHIVLRDSEVLLALPLPYPRLSRLASPGSYFELSILREEQFVLQNKGTILREIADEYFMKSGFEPKILLEVETLEEAAQVGQATGHPYFTTVYAVPQKSGDVALWAAGTRRHYYEALTYRRDAFFTAGDRDFIELVRTIYSEQDKNTKRE